MNRKYNPMYHNLIVRNYKEDFQKKYGYPVTKLTDEMVFTAFIEAFDYSSDGETTDENTLERMKEREDEQK